jgi:hypothetical protein
VLEFWNNLWVLGLGTYPFSLSQSSCMSPVELILTGEGWRGRSLITLDDGEKAWSLTNHSILSDLAILPRDFRLQSKGTVPNK